MRKKFTVKIGEQKTRLLVDLGETINNFNDLPNDFNGGRHNYDGIKGFVIYKAVKKLFGKNCFWWGNHSDLSRGQVFKSTKYSNNSETAVVSVEVLDGWV